jgi:hypothetical protein
MEVGKLELVPTDELVAELFSRYDSVIFTAHRHDTKKDDMMAWNTKGNKYMLLGLNEYMDMKIRTMTFGPDYEDNSE